MAQSEPRCSTDAAVGGFVLQALDRMRDEPGLFGSLFLAQQLLTGDDLVPPYLAVSGDSLGRHNWGSVPGIGLRHAD